MRLVLVVALAALVVSCSPKPKAEPPAAAAPAITLYALDCGHIAVSDLDAFADDGSLKDKSRDLVDTCFLIRHPTKGDLLWDSGLPDAIAQSPKGVTQGPFHITIAKTLASQLDQLGVKPADIEYFSISHSHFDHLGNANLVAGSTFLVDPAEKAFMFRADAKKAKGEFANYDKLETAKQVELPAGPYDVFGDGSVTLYPTPGHTPGHRVLLAKLPTAGAVLLAGDMWHLLESREKRLVPRFNTDRAQTLASMDFVEKLAADTHARVVRQHVAEDFAALPAFPEPLR